MSKKIKLTTASLLAISAVTPAAVFANEVEVLEPGFYTADGFISIDAFGKLSTAEKVAKLQDRKAVLVLEDNTALKASLILTATNNELRNARQSVADYEQANGVKITKDGVKTSEAAAVVSVSAINAKQLIVKFNKEVDVNSAQTIANYTFSDGNSVVANGATVLEDGKSVKLTLTNAYTTATNVAVTVKGVALKSDVNQTFPLFSTVVKVEDTVKPEITKVDAITNGSTATSATIYFSEPVKEGIVKIDGQSVATITSTVESLPVSGLSLDVSKTHKVEIVNLKDTADNVNALATTEFTVKKDADAPTVASVQAYGDYKILVTFNKKVNASTVAPTDISVKDELLNNVSVSGFDPLTGDTTGTKFVITLDKTQPEVSGLYTNKDTRNLTIVFADKSIDDTLGNQLAATTRTVTLSKDVTAPSVTGITFEKDATTKQVTKLKVTFDEEISSLDLSKFTIVDANGVLKNSILTGASVSVSGKEATIDIADATLTGSYSFQIASGAASDLALTPNKSKAFTGTVNFGAAETTGSFDFVDGDNDPTNGEVAEANNVITVTFPEAVKGGAVAGSATDVNNYSINGKPLPAGTTITLDSTQKVATITLPDESIATSDSNAVFTINNVQSLTNKTIKPVTTTVAIVDNVDPVLQSAKVLDNKTIELTYSENIAALSNTNVGTEFKIYQGTTALTLADSELKANSVSGFPTKIRLTVAQGVDAPATPATKATATVDFGTVADDTDALTLTAKTAGTGGNGIVVKFVNAVANGTTNATYDAGTKTLTVELADDGTTSAGNVNATTADVVAAINGATGTPVDAAVVNTGAGLAAVVGDATTANGADEIPATSATTLDLTKDLFVETLVPASGVDVLDARGNKQKADVKISVSK